MIDYPENLLYISGLKSAAHRRFNVIDIDLLISFNPMYSQDLIS